MRQRAVNLLASLEFYLKVVLACTLVQQLFHVALSPVRARLGVLEEAAIFWFAGSFTTYAIGLLIERGLKGREDLRRRWTVRTAQLKPQPFPPFTASGIALGEAKGFATALLLVWASRHVDRGADPVSNAGWFLLSIASADLLFFIAHWTLHRRPFLPFHLKHHHFRDTSSFVAGYKSNVEYCITTLTDYLPVLLLGHDITQLCAWVVVGTAFNLEGHSSLSILFVGWDFHDRHHTGFRDNYSIQGFWDVLFGTLREPARQRRFPFLVNTLLAPAEAPPSPGPADHATAPAEAVGVDP